MGRAAAFAFLLFALPAGAQEWAGGPASAEARYTGGYGGYWGVQLHGDASMSVDPYTRPFAALDFQTDQLYKNDWTFKLGAEEDVGLSWTGRAALGVVAGQLRDAGNTGSGYLLDLGTERRVGAWRLGAGYQVSFGQVEPVGSPIDVERHSAIVAEQQAAASGNGLSAPDKFWLHQVSASASGPLPGALSFASLGFGVVGWDRLDDGSTGIAERADLDLRLGSSWTVSGGVSLEEPFASGEKSGLYETAALRYAVPTVMPGGFATGD